MRLGRHNRPRLLPGISRRRRLRGRGTREALGQIWQSGGLLILGILAAGMTAFPNETLTALRPIASLAGFGWRLGLGGVQAVQDATAAGARGLRSLSSLAREARELEHQLQSLEQRTVLKEEQQRELVRLRRLLMLKDETGSPTITARVIGGDPSSFFSSLVLDVGAEDGVREGQAVVAPAGAVGRILSVGPASSVALWLCDPRSRVTAYVQRGRVKGVLAGTGTGCVVRYLAAGDDVKVGDRVLTAGGDSAFPKGILIGVVKEVRRDGILLAAELVPAVSVRRLEEVLVLTRGAAQAP
ncbi:MAG: rod shape-determining protein MreC [Candidatus Coatesbacteria bacterium]